MISGLLVREAVGSDLPQIKQLVDAHRHELGFVPLPALCQALGRGWLLVAEEQGVVVGAMDWWARKDGVISLYNIVVGPDHRGKGVGRCLLQGLVGWARRHGAKEISLKCPEALPSNGFYARSGFILQAREPGKRRALNCWTFPLSPMQ